MAEEQIRVIGDLQRVPFKPGDRVVVKVDDHITREKAAHIRTVVTEWCGDPSVSVIVLTRGMSIDVIGPEN